MRTNMIDFPDWVTDPTTCKTRSMTLVIAKGDGRFRHGAQKMVGTFTTTDGKPVELSTYKSASGRLAVRLMRGHLYSSRMVY